MIVKALYAISLGSVAILVLVNVDALIAVGLLFAACLAFGSKWK